MPATAPPVTAIRCRIVSVDQFGGARVSANRSGSTCPRVLRGADTHATLVAVYEHLRNDHQVCDEEADYHGRQWRDQAERRIGARLVLTDVLTEQGIEATEEQVKALVASLARRHAPIHVDHRTVYGPRNHG